MMHAPLPHSCRMSGPSPFECSVCMEDYNFDTPDGQAITLPCGHSFDRLCLSRVRHMKCPTCRASFAGDVGIMAPNFALRDAMLERVPATDPDVEALENLLGIEVIKSMVLPSDALVLGEAISRAGGTCVVRRGTLRGVQASLGSPLTCMHTMLGQQSCMSCAGKGLRMQHTCPDGIAFAMLDAKPTCHADETGVNTPVLF